MAVAYSAVTQPGLFSQQYPPPLLPKPGKDNRRLQKLLKRTAKKKASTQAAQSAAPFRSSLSPVNEASPDLERSDHSTPPKTPETPYSFYSYQQPPRFTVRPLYQHVSSPYPQRAAFGRAARFSPQTVASPSYFYSQHVTVASHSASASGVSPAPGPVFQPAETHADLTPAAAAATTQPKPTSHGLTPYPTSGGQAVIRPLTVLTPFVRSKSPRPTFKATEPSRSPKPMFDVPQIRMYTASTSYYETSRTPPVYDTAALTAIGSTVPQSKTVTEPKHDLTPASEVRRDITQIAQPPLLSTDAQRKTPTLEIKRVATPTAEINTITTPASEIKKATPTIEIKRATPTSELKTATPTSELKTATPTSELKTATPTSELKTATPTSEFKTATPTSELKAATPTSQLKAGTPTSEGAKTPTYELQISRTLAGRPKTPAYHMTRAPTPVFEISRTNPLLFAVSPITVEPERSVTPKMVSATSSSSTSQNEKTTEPKSTETILNGDIHSDMTHAAKPIQQSIKKAKSEPDLTREKLPTAPADSQRPKTPISYGYQRSKTPTYEASRLMTTLPGYKRPRTPTYGTSPSGVSPVAFQRPKTPTQVAHKSKSGYRGLTPAEYAAHGGIKTYSPAFGILSSKTATQEEVKAAKEESVDFKTLSQEPSEVSKVKQTKAVDKPQLRDEKFSATPSIPIIVVSQPSDTSVTTITQETSMVSSQIAAKQEQDVIKETPKAKPPIAEGRTPVKEKKIQVQEVAKPKAKTPEAKHPLPKGDGQDPLNVVRKLLGKDKVQAGTTEAKVSEQKEPAKPKASSKTTTEGSKPSNAAPALPVKVPAESTQSEDKGKDKKAETSSAVKSAPAKKEGDEVLPEAESLLKVIKKPKGLKTKLSGWSRLKKHMVVEQEEPKFPETGPQKEATGQDQSGEKKAEGEAGGKPDDKAGGKPGETPDAQDKNQTQDTPKATKMWEAVLFQMFSTKENIMHQIELNKTEKELVEETKKELKELKEIPSFAHRLPVLLFSPRFDAKKLREAASRPVTKISTVFEMGLIGRKGKDEEPKDFNRKARGFTSS